MKILALAATLIMAAIIANPQQLPPSVTPVIAVLENPQCKETDLLAVRALFAKNDTGWVALTDRDRFDRAPITPGMPWTIAFEGRNLGTVQISNYFPDIARAWTFPRDMVIGLAAHQDPPLISNTEGQFWGWCDPPQNRPLVLVNGPNFQDPEEWKSFTPESSMRQSLYPAFHQVADSVYFCPEDIEKYVLFDYQWTDLELIDGLRNSSGQTIIAIGLNRTKYGCDGVIGPNWDTHWFLIADQPVFIGRGLTFVDAGDYDADGKSEFLFWYSAYNRDGYSLYSEDFMKRVDFWWGYT